MEGKNICFIGLIIIMCLTVWHALCSMMSDLGSYEGAMHSIGAIVGMGALLLIFITLKE